MALYMVTVVTVVVFLVTVDLTTVTTLKPLYFNGLNGVKRHLVTVVTVQLFFYAKRAASVPQPFDYRALTKNNKKW